MRRSANLSDFDEAKAKEYRDAAVEELTAAGATFPSRCSTLYNPACGGTGMQQCAVFKQQVEGVLNDGFLTLSTSFITQGPPTTSPNAVPWVPMSSCPTTGVLTTRPRDRG